MAKSAPVSYETIQNPQGGEPAGKAAGAATINILLELGRVLGR